MKRVAVIAIFMAVMASLFAFPVFGTTYSPDTYNTYSDSVTYNGVTYYIRATQLKALSTGTSMLPGGMETIILIQLQMTNNNSSAASATIPKFNIDLRDSGSIITDVYTYGGDFTLGILSGGNGIFYPGSDFADGNNKVIVPPGKSLYCVGAIGLPAQLDQTGSSTLDNGLRGVHLYDKSNYQVTTGNYSYGNPVDLSSIITYIDNIDENIDDINIAIANIVNAVTYSGAFASVIPSASQQYVAFSGLTSADAKFDISGRRVISVPIVDSIDSYLDPVSDTQKYNVQCHYDVSYYFLFNNKYSNSQSAYLASLNYLQVYAPNSGGYQNNVVDFQSDVFEEYYVPQASQVRFIPKYRNTSGRALYPSNGSYVYIKFRFYFTYSGGNLPNLQTFDASIINGLSNGFTSTAVDQVITNTDSSALRNIERAIQNILDSYKSVNGLDDIDDTSDEVTTKSETAHTQEQSYFTQNAQAIQQTGLSNYRFNGDQENGIGSVSHDFTLLWNALGGFNSIYVFSLTLSLALMILRHAPGAIKSSRRNKEE